MTDLAYRGIGARSSRRLGNSAAAAYAGGLFLDDPPVFFSCRPILQPCANSGAGLNSTGFRAFHLRSALPLLDLGAALSRVCIRRRLVARFRFNPQSAKLNIAVGIALHGMRPHDRGLPRRPSTTSLAARQRVSLLAVRPRLGRCISLCHELFEVRVDLVFGPGNTPGADFDRSRELAGLHQPAEMVAAVGYAFLPLKLGKGQKPHATSPQ